MSAYTRPNLAVNFILTALFLIGHAAYAGDYGYKKETYNFAVQRIGKDAVVHGMQASEKIQLEQIRITDLGLANALLHGFGVRCHVMSHASETQRFPTALCQLRDLTTGRVGGNLGGIPGGDVGRYLIDNKAADYICNLPWWRPRRDDFDCYYENRS